MATTEHRTKCETLLSMGPHLSAVPGPLRFYRCLQALDSWLVPFPVPSPPLADAVPMTGSNSCTLLLLMEAR